MGNNADIIKVIKRILREDKNKYYDWMEPSEGRGCFGTTTITREDEQMYGLEKGKMIAVTKSFMSIADPGMSDTPTSEFAFIIDKLARVSDEKLTLRLAYADLDDGYDFLAQRVNNPMRVKALDSDKLIDDWKQKRL